MIGKEESMGEISDSNGLDVLKRTEDKLYLTYWAERGKELIESDFRILTGVHEVCASLHISPSHFREVFSAAYGTSPKKYLTTVKIENAKILLRDESKKVCEVARLTGFRQCTSFERVFKKNVGITATEYRRMTH